MLRRAHLQDIELVAFNSFLLKLTHYSDYNIIYPDYYLIYYSLIRKNTLRSLSTLLHLLLSYFLIINLILCILKYVNYELYFLLVHFWLGQS